MRYKIICLLFTCVMVSACQSTNPDTGSYKVAVNSGSTIQRTKLVPVPVAGQLMSIKGGKSSPRLVGEAAIEAANKKAMQQPNSGEYINSIMTFDYMAGALYQIYCAPLSVTDVQFQNNEHVIAVGAGDTLRWQVSKTFSGAGTNRQEHLLIKPVDEGLTNSIVVTTDLRTYHLMLHSTAKTYMASVTWRYPDSEGLVTNFDTDQDASIADVTHGVDVDRLNFNYVVKLVKGKQAPDWYPRMIFNDGSKTYIKLPSQAAEAPTLFVGNSVKNDQLINYRVQGNYYVVDSIIDQAQLRGGQKDQSIVQITFKK